MLEGLREVNLQHTFWCYWACHNWCHFCVILSSVQQKWQILKCQSLCYYQFYLPTSPRSQLDDSLTLIITWSSRSVAVAVHMVPMAETLSRSAGYITHHDWGGLISQISVTTSILSLQKKKTRKVIISNVSSYQSTSQVSASTWSL